MSDEAEWRESLRKEYERANHWKALYTVTVGERDALRAVLMAVAEYNSGDDTILGALHALDENRKIALAALATEDTTNA